MTLTTTTNIQEKYLARLDEKTRQSQTSILSRYLENKSDFMENLKSLSVATKKNYLAVINAYETYAIDNSEASTLIETQVLELQKARLTKAEIETKKQLKAIAEAREQQMAIQAELERLEESQFESNEIPASFVKFNPEEYIPKKSWVTKEILGKNFENFVKMAKTEKFIVLAGPAGTAKSESCIKFCAINEIPLFKFQCSIDTQVSDIFTSKTLEIESDKQVVKNLAGMALKAILCANKYGRAMLQLEEANAMTSQIQKIFNSLADDTRFIDLPFGRIELSKGAQIWIVCTINENYSGTNPLNKDFVDRFSYLAFDKLSEKDTTTIIKQIYADISEDEIRDLIGIQINYHNLIETNRIADNVEFGIRTMKKYANLRKNGFTRKESINASLVNKILNVEDKQQVQQLVRVF